MNPLNIHFLFLLFELANAVSYRISRHIGTRIDFIERCYNEREQHCSQPIVFPNREKKKDKSKKHTNTMSLVSHFMEFAIEQEK